MMEIKVEEVKMENGEETVKILNLKALPKSKLPKEYLNGDIRCFRKENGLMIEYYDDENKLWKRGMVKFGELMSKGEFYGTFLPALYKCGEKLMEVNKGRVREVLNKKEFFI